MESIPFFAVVSQHLPLQSKSSSPSSTLQAAGEGVSTVGANAFRTTESDDEDSDDDFSDDEELQSPIDDVDPFVFFVDTIKVLQASDPLRFQNITQTLDFHYQALANGVAQHAEQRREEIEKKKLEKATCAVAAAS